MGRRTPFSELSDKDKSFIVNYCATNEDSDLKFEKYSSLTRVNDNRVFQLERPIVLNLVQEKVRIRRVLERLQMKKLMMLLKTSIHQKK